MAIRYDYLIVGSGLFGSVFAHEAKKKGKKVLVIDKRPHLGGNIYCDRIEDIHVHRYGAHIFHTNDEKIWRYVNQLTPFNNFVNSPLAVVGDKIYNLPFNMNTFYQLWGIINPEEAKKKITAQVAKYGVAKPKNLEEQALSLVGKDIYNKLIKGYTEKQWGRKAIDLPSFIIKRLPLRYTFDNNYFSDRFQGIPIGGYNKLIDVLLCGIETKISTDYFSDRDYFNKLADKIVYTGKIDEFFDYKLGCLSYRSLHFDTQLLNVDNYQGNAVVNFNDINVPYTRIIEHKHFDLGAHPKPKTVITREFPQDWDLKKEAYYPINDEHNQFLYKKYQALAQSKKRFIFGGRLAEYRYYDMHQIIASALKTAKSELKIEW